MIVRTKFLAIEGIDGAGKRTQIDLLSKLLDERGVKYVRFSFPRYDSFFGSMVGRFLNGEYGLLDAVDPHFSALLFAGDRLEARRDLMEALQNGVTVLADRYVGSNLAHQTARVPPQHREAFLVWLKHLEYKVYDLPVEDLVVYLRLPATDAQRLVGKKTARDYTPLQRDLQESSLAHLEQAALVYDRLAKEPNWVTVECSDPATGALRPAAEIHKALVAAVEARAAYMVKRERRRKFGPHDPPRI